ncbi:hypothetical protein RB595_003564 [Gaeumannomyces hyphopodioides]
MPAPDEPIQTVFDVLIIGAGPGGLAMASRLREPSPSALFTDEEHQRYHWIRKHGSRMSLKRRKSGNVIPKRGGGGGGDCEKCVTTKSQQQRQPRYKMLVLDATSGEWLGRWDGLFGAFQITHLRSPMFFHVDPADRDALLARAYERGQQDELLELRGCVGKEISKHLRKARASRNPRRHSIVEINERERKDYFTPPQSLFSDHCHSVADRYGLRDGVLRHESVLDIEYSSFQDPLEDKKLFKVKTDKGSIHYAKTVVLAVGPGNAPCIPKDIEGLYHAPGAPLPPRVCHAMMIKGEFPDPSVGAVIAEGRRPANVLVVGGGLTSAQLTDLAIRRGVSKVWHLVRGRSCQIKYFDADLAWVGKYRNVEQANFWGAESDVERLRLIREARSGGSMTPMYHKRLKAHMAAGRLELRTGTKVTAAEFDEESQTWTVTTEPAPEKGVEMPAFDFIYFATGIDADIGTLPFLQGLRRSHPIETQGGLPCLNDDLMWCDGVPLFVTGRFAGLRLGPFATNLGGVRTGAERISWAIEEVLEARRRGGGDSGDGNDTESGLSEAEMDELDFVTGRNNMFRKLSIAEGDEW